jgi:hypothetical protein
MSQLHIELNQERAAFEPGEELTGKVRWQFDQAPRKLELRLFWFTRGQGTEDAGVLETVRFDSPKPEEFRPFRLRLPSGPYSFSGKLFSVAWALELLATPAKEVARVEFVMGPGGQQVQLETLPETESSKRSFV